MGLLACANCESSDQSAIRSKLFLQYRFLMFHTLLIWHWSHRANVKADLNTCCLQMHYKRAMIALNRSPEFNSSNPKPSAAEATIWANSEELNYAIHYTKFQAFEPSGTETADFFHIAYEFLHCFKPRSHFGPSNLDLNKIGKGPLGNAIYLISSIWGKWSEGEIF